jgi:predicted acetylornithine/succinylornithine family transaminase
MSVKRQEQMMELANRRLTHNYKQQPVVMARGEGCYLWDVAGNRYLDMTSGIAVSLLGHGHPVLVKAIADQAQRLIHTSNLYFIEQQIKLADKLVSRSFSPDDGQIFFCNSGAEANEAALKLARRLQHVVCGRPERIELVACEGSFHGRTFATVALTGQEKYRAGIGPLVEPVRFMPFGEIAAAREVITDRTCAIIIEPVQGEGGVRQPPPGYLAALREHCSKTGTVLIFDEVQTGVGRTGTFFGYEHDGVAPDVVTLAKGLAGGVPIGAMIARPEVARGFEPGVHASTFGGNALAASAALAVLEVIESEHLLERVKGAGQRLGAGLEALAAKGVARGRAYEARGRGLLRGLSLGHDAAPLVGKCREKGLLLSVAGGTVLRFVPPLIVSDEQIDSSLEILGAVLEAQ